MLAQTLREWEQRNIRRGREEGREEGIDIGVRRGVKRGREAERRRLCGLAARRFGGTTAEAIRPLLGSMRDEAEFAAVGALIVDSETAAELIDGVRRLARSNDSRA